MAQARPPFIAYIYPAGGQQGKTVIATLGGIDLTTGGVRISGKGVNGKVTDTASTSVRISLAIARDAELGEREIRLITDSGVSNRIRFIIGDLPEVVEKEPNSEKEKAQRLESLPVVVNGQVMEGDRDFFRFSAKAGQTLVCDVQARRLVPYIADAVPGWNDACISLYDSSGKELAYSDDFRFRPDPLITFKLPKDGDYLIEIKDILYRGREDFTYRLTLGALPYLTHIYPLGARRGSMTQVELCGVNLSQDSISVALPQDGPPLRIISPGRNGTISNLLPFAASDLDETEEHEPNDSIAQANRVTPPVTINGRIQRKGDSDYFLFKAKEKQQLVLEVFARRLESPLDSILTLFSAKGDEIKENDDAIDPNEPLITHHADSRIVHTFTSAGDYVVRIRDTQGMGGEEYAYRLTLAPPQPDFALRITPDNPRVGRGDTALLTVEAVRKDDFKGPINLAVEGLPRGFIMSDAAITTGQDQVRFTITAPANAPNAMLTPTITGTARIGKEPVVRKAVAAEVAMQAFSYSSSIPTKEFLLAVAEPTFFMLSTNIAPEQVIEIPQGTTNTQIIVKVIRKEGMKGGIILAPAAQLSGVTYRSSFVAADKDETTITLVASKTAPIGVKQTLIITGAYKMVKDSIQRVAPAIGVRVVAAQP
ncbi:MAG: hypothetical protein NTX50_29150 [Candidatus Sumerlaeota bacterium]|nr:hypothetical protein [Candidatus Sumerlaeota bacterium]